MSSIEGETLILRLVRAGEIVGLGCVMSGGRHEFTAEALDDCWISFVDGDTFRQFIRQHNDACVELTPTTRIQVHGSAQSGPISWFLPLGGIEAARLYWIH